MDKNREEKEEDDNNNNKEEEDNENDDNEKGEDENDDKGQQRRGSLRGSHVLSARRLRRTKSRRPERPQTRSLLDYQKHHIFPTSCSNSRHFSRTAFKSSNILMVNSETDVRKLQWWGVKKPAMRLNLVYDTTPQNVVSISIRTIGL